MYKFIYYYLRFFIWRGMFFILQILFLFSTAQFVAFINLQFLNNEVAAMHQYLSINNWIIWLLVLAIGTFGTKMALRHTIFNKYKKIHIDPKIKSVSWPFAITVELLLFGSIVMSCLFLNYINSLYEPLTKHSCEHTDDKIILLMLKIELAAFLIPVLLSMFIVKYIVIKHSSNVHTIVK